MCFNVSISRQTESMAEEYGVKILSANSIYTLFDSYNEFEKELKNMNLEKKLERLRLPSKFVFIKGNVFRRSSPCVFGVEVLEGEIRQNYPIINAKGDRIGRILDIESDKTKLNRAVMGDKVAISIDDAVYGRNILEGDLLYTDIGMSDVMKFDDVAEELTADYKEALSEIRRIKGI